MSTNRSIPSYDLAFDLCEFSECEWCRTRLSRREFLRRIEPQEWLEQRLRKLDSHLVASDVPFCVLALDQTLHLVVAIGKAFQIFDCQRLHLKFVGHAEDKISALASTDGLVFAAVQCDILIFQRGKEIARLKGHKKPVTSLLVFGEHLLALDELNVLRVWDFKANELYCEIELLEDFAATCMMHPATYLNKILLGSQQGALQLWNIRTSKKIHDFAKFESAVLCLSQSPVVDVVAVGLVSGTIALMNLKLDQRLFSFHQDGLVSSLSFRTDGEPILASASSSGDICFWNLEKRCLSFQQKAAHNGSIPAIEFLFGQSLLVSNSADNSLKMWNFESIDREPSLLRFRSGHSAPPSRIRFQDAFGRWILSAGNDRAFRLFSIFHEGQNVELSQGSIGAKSRELGVRPETLKLPPILQFATLETRQREWDNIVTCHLNSSFVQSWSFKKKAIGTHRLDMPDGSVARSVALSACGNYAFAGCGSGRVEMFNIQSGLHRRTHEGHTMPVVALCVDAANRFIYSGSIDGTINVWRFADGALADTLHLGCAVNQLQLHPENNLLAVSSDDLCLRIFDVSTRQLAREFRGHSARITDLAFSPDGRLLVSSSVDATVRTWDLPSGFMVDCFRVDNVVVSLAFSPRGDFLATAHVDHNGICLWSSRLYYENVVLGRMLDSESVLMRMPTAPDMEVVHPDTEESMADQTTTPSPLVSTTQLEERLITFSTVAKSRWQNLLNLETIKERNKPKEPPKAPEAAPFFLPSLSSNESAANSEIATTNGDGAEHVGSRLLQLGDLRPQTDFTRAFLGYRQAPSTSTSDVFFDVMKALSPSALDFELRSIQSSVDSSELLAYLSFMVERLACGRDFELVQAYLNKFIQIHGETLAKSSTALPYFEQLKLQQRLVWDRLGGMFHSVFCLIEFLRQS